MLCSNMIGVSVKAELWTMDWTVYWTVYWSMDWVATHSMHFYGIQWKHPAPLCLFRTHAQWI